MGVRSSTRRVALFQPVLAHYRVDLFDALDRPAERAITLFTVDPDPGSGLAGAGERLRVARRRARTFRLGPLWFQPAALRQACFGRWGVLVLSWNARQVELIPVLLVARLRGVPVILWGHGLGRSRIGAVTRLRSLQASWASAVLTYSAEGRRRVEELAPGTKVRVLPNTTGRPAPGREQLLGEVRGQVAFLGRLDRRKQVGRLLEALALLRDDGPVLQAHVIGTGPMREALEARAQELGLARQVTWHPPTTDWAELRTLLAGCDLVVLPAHAGLAVVDAMAAGRGCVVPDDASLSPPEADNVIDGVTGRRYTPATAAGLAACLASAYADPGSLVALSEQAAAAYSESLTLDVAEGAFADLLDEVVDDG